MTSTSTPHKQEDDISTPTPSLSPTNAPPSYELLNHDQSTDAPSSTPSQPQTPPNLIGPLLGILMLMTILILVLSLNIHGLLTFIPYQDPEWAWAHRPPTQYTDQPIFILSSIAEVLLSMVLLGTIVTFAQRVNEKRAANETTTTLTARDLEMGDLNSGCPDTTAPASSQMMDPGSSFVLAFFAVVIYIIATACSGVGASRIFTFAFVVFWGAFVLDFALLGGGRLILRLVEMGVARIVKGNTRGHVYVPVPVTAVGEEDVGGGEGM